MRIIKVLEDKDMIPFFEKLFMLSKPLVALDIEADSLDFTSGNILSMQLKINDEDAVYVLVGEEIVLKNFRRLLSVPNITIIGHNLKFDLRYLVYKTLDALNIEQMKFKNVKLFDTMLAHRLTCVGLSDCSYYISLQDLLEKYLKISLDKEVRDKFENANILTDEMIVYAAKDVFHLFDLYQILKGELDKVKHTKVFELEMSLLPVVVMMEVFGVNMDVEGLENISKYHLQQFEILRQEIIDSVIPKLLETNQYTNLLDVITKIIGIKIKTKRDQKLYSSISTQSQQAREILADLINIASPLQLKNILVNVFGLDIPDTNEHTLKLKIMDGDVQDEQKEIIDKILRMRDHYKKSTAFGKGYLKYIRSDGRIHAEFNQLGTDTGRFSSSNPNLQQIPRDKEYRKLFRASEGWKIISADYSQMELRMMFDISREKRGIEAYRKGEDIHRLTASFLFDKSPEEVTDEERSLAKSVNFAVIYGTTAAGLEYRLNIPRKKAEEILEKFYKSYPNMAAFIRKVSELVLERGYSITPYGRKRFFQLPKYYKDKKELYSAVNRIKRQGVNHIIQGGCADAVKIAMVNIFRNNPFGKDLRIIMQVHDEIVVEVKEDIAEQAKEFIESEMRKAFQMFLREIPAVVEAKIADHWTK